MHAPNCDVYLSKLFFLTHSLSLSFVNDKGKFEWIPSVARHFDEFNFARRPFETFCEKIFLPRSLFVR